MKDDNCILHSSGSNERSTKRRSARRGRVKSGTLSNKLESVPECTLLHQPQKCSRLMIDIFGKRIPLLSSSTGLCQPTVIKRWWITKLEKSCITRVLSLRPPPKVASWTAKYWETSCGSSDDKTRSRLKIWRYSNLNKLAAHNILENFCMQLGLIQIKMHCLLRCDATLWIRFSARN